MKKYSFRAAALLIALWHTPAFAGDIGYKTPGEALADLKSKPGITSRQENGWIVLHDETNHTIWSITSETVAAHPTVVKRVLIERDGKLLLEMNVLCQATKVICDTMVGQFQQLNQNIQSQLQN